LVTFTACFADDADDLRPHLSVRDPPRSEHPRREALLLLLTQKCEEEVLGADVVVPERPRLILGKHQNLPGAIREQLKHLSRGYPRDDAGLAQCSGMTPEGRG
jgi:hypothetical protein